MAKTKTHDIKRWTLAVGTADLEGLGPDAGVEIAPVSGDFESDVGSDGEVTVWAIHDERYLVTVTLKAASASNAILSALRQANKLQTDGTGFFTVLAQNQADELDKFSSRLACIKTPPTRTIKGSADVKVWVIECYEGFDGHGNPPTL